MKKYKVNEIFYSLQGEGMYTGFPIIFVRFSGCNKRCHFCDTQHNEGDLLSATEIVNTVYHISTCRRVVLTGGEPLLQFDDELADLLILNDLIIHVETNGSILPKKSVWNKINWLTVSPKDESWILKSGNELKVVFEGQELEKYFDSEFEEYFLQPCSMKNIQETIKAVKDDPRWALSFQQQKILNIR